MKRVTIRIIPWFGVVRAQCESCDLFGESDFYSSSSQISQAIENLIVKSLGSSCSDHIPNTYSPKNDCRIYAGSLAQLKETIYTVGTSRFPAILVNNRYKIKVDFALDYEWKPYQYSRQLQLKEKDMVEDVELMHAPSTDLVMNTKCYEHDIEPDTKINIPVEINEDVIDMQEVNPQFSQDDYEAKVIKLAFVGGAIYPIYVILGLSLGMHVLHMLGLLN